MSGIVAYTRQDLAQIIQIADSKRGQLKNLNKTDQKTFQTIVEIFKDPNIETANLDARSIKLLSKHLNKLPDREARIQDVRESKIPIENASDRKLEQTFKLTMEGVKQGKLYSPLASIGFLRNHIAETHPKQSQKLKMMEERLFNEIEKDISLLVEENKMTKEEGEGLMKSIKLLTKSDLPIENRELIQKQLSAIPNGQLLQSRFAERRREKATQQTEGKKHLEQPFVEEKTEKRPEREPYKPGRVHAARIKSSHVLEEKAEKKTETTQEDPSFVRTEGKKGLDTKPQILEETTEKRTELTVLKPMGEEKAHLDPNSTEGIAAKLTELSKTNVASDENLKLLQEELEKADEEIKKLGITSKTDVYKLDLEILKKLNILNTSLGNVKFPTGNIVNHANYNEIKDNASKTKGKIPDVAIALTVSEQKRVFSRISEFYMQSEDLYNSMSKTKFNKTTMFEVDNYGTAMSVPLKDFKLNLETKEKIAKRTLTKEVPSLVKSANNATPEEKMTVLTSQESMQVLSGTSKQSEKLLDDAFSFLNALPDPTFKGKKAEDNKVNYINEKRGFLKEINDMKALVKQRKKELRGEELFPWSLHQSGEIDLNDFQKRLTDFVKNHNHLT